MSSPDRRGRAGLRPAPESLSPSVFEATVANVIAASRLRSLPLPVRDASYDFLLRDRKDRRLALESKAGRIWPELFAVLAERLRRSLDSFDLFVLVTAITPTPRQKDAFGAALVGLGKPCHLLALHELPAFLGVELPDLRTALGVSGSQVAAITARIDQYAPETIGLGRERRNTSAALQPGYDPLTRQFSIRTILRLQKGTRPLQETLRVGRHAENAVVVLSDLCHFSDLVAEARPEDLAEAMARYYRRARELVWTYDGVLDKFIGDAVLAIFGYPFDRGDAPRAAALFAAGLVEAGREVVTELQDTLNSPVADTGTRVGMSSGNLSVLDIGQQSIEVSFVGDVINLAARLEKQCRPNGVLMDNRTWGRLRKVHPDLDRDLPAERRAFTPEEVKGQRSDVVAWQLRAQDVEPALRTRGSTGPRAPAPPAPARYRRTRHTRPAERP